MTLELPPELTARWVHPTFPMNLIRAHMPNDDVKFPCHDMKSFYDFRATDKPKWFVNEILAHHWVDQVDLEFQVCWTLGDVMWELLAWEPLASCKQLTALDEYLELCGPNGPTTYHTKCISHVRIMPHMILVPSRVQTPLYSFEIFGAAIELVVHHKP